MLTRRNGLLNNGQLLEVEAVHVSLYRFGRNSDLRITSE